MWLLLVVETVKVLRMDSSFQLTCELAGRCIRWIEMCWNIRQDQSRFVLRQAFQNPLGQIHQVLGLGPSKFVDVCYCYGVVAIREYYFLLQTGYLNQLPLHHQFLLIDLLVLLILLLS